MTIELPRRVAENIEQFTGRAWLLPKLLKWWDNRKDERIFLLTGGPGTGKSMILAWLAGFGPEPQEPQKDALPREQLSGLRRMVKAAHFCQAASRNIAPQAFAESIAKQLRVTVKGFAGALTATLAERVQITATQTVGTVATGGAVTGVSIGRIDLGALGDELSFDRTFTQPLKRLYASGHTEPMLLLVDALDEADTYTGVKIPDLLSRLSDLPTPIRILATTRDEPRVLKFFRGIKPFDLIKETDPNVDDVRTYAIGRLANLTTVEAHKREEFAQRLGKQAGGVFLYAAMVLDKLLERPPAELPKLDNYYPLPYGLSGLYHDFLTRELGKDEQRWFDVYEPLLGLIAIAQGDGLTAQQLTDIVGKDIRPALRASKQYLSGELPDGPFRLFHKSFADFLLEEKDNVDYHIDAQAMHQRIAMFYWNMWDTDWRGCDKYGLSHLAGHLFEADDANRLRQLISPNPQSENAWYIAKAMAGDLDGWEADVNRALRLAEKSMVVDLQVRYALCLSSVRSLKVPAALLDLCLQEKVLEWPQALGLAKRHQDPAMRASVICRIAGRLPERECERIVVHEFEAASRVQDVSLRVLIYVALARYLPEQHFGDVLSAAKQIDTDSLRAEAIVAYAPRLPEHYFAAALELARSIRDAVSKLRSLGALAVRQPQAQALLAKVRAVAGEMEPNYEQVSALCEIACHVHGKPRKVLLDQAFTIANKLDYSSGLASALAAFAQAGISKEQLADVLNLARQTSRDEDHPGTTAGYVSVLAALGPLLSAEQRLEYVGKLVTALQGRSEWFNRRIANKYVPLLVPYLPQDRQPEAFAKYTRSLIQSIVGDAFALDLSGTFCLTLRSDVTLRALALWPAHMLDETLDEVRAIDQPDLRAELLHVIVVRLPKERRAPILQAELDRVRNNKDRVGRAKALTALVANVPANERARIAEEALQASEAIVWCEDRMKIICALAPHFPPKRGSSLVKEALATLRDIKDGYQRAKGLAALAPCLPETLIPDALDIVRSLGTDDYLAMASLAGHLPEGQRPDIVERSLRAVQGVVTAELPKDCVQVLQALLPHMQTDRVVQALTIAKQISSSHERELASALGTLAPRLHGSQREEAFDIVQGLSQYQHRILATAAFQRDLACRQSADALTKALAIDQDDSRATVLCKLLPYLKGTQRLEAFKTMLRSCLGVRVAFTVSSTVTRRPLEREFLLERIGDVADTLRDIDGENAAAQVAFAISETAVWWP